MTLGQAIRAAMGAMTQAELARAVGRDQTTISLWCSDSTRPSLEQLRAIELACDRPIGSILRAAGYVDEVVTVPDAIRADPALSDEGRRMLLAVYDAAVTDAGEAKPAARAAKRQTKGKAEPKWYGGGTPIPVHDDDLAEVNAADDKAATALRLHLERNPDAELAEDLVQLAASRLDGRPDAGGDVDLEVLDDPKPRSRARKAAKK